MNRLIKEYIKSIEVCYHICRCPEWPQKCSGQTCPGHVGRVGQDGTFEELSADEYNFLKDRLGVPRNIKYYEFHNTRKYNRRGQVVSEGITSASELYKFLRKREHRTYINVNQLITKYGCKIVEYPGCCYCESEEE